MCPRPSVRLWKEHRYITFSPVTWGTTAVLTYESVYLLCHPDLRHRRISLLRQRSVDAFSLVFQVLRQIRPAARMLLLPLPPTVARLRLLLFVELPEKLGVCHPLSCTQTGEGWTYLGAAQRGFCWVSTGIIHKKHCFVFVCDTSTILS